MTHSYAARAPVDAKERLETVKAEREIITREIAEVQAFLQRADGNANPVTAHLKWAEYHRERAAKQHRFRELAEMVRPLNAEIKRLNIEIAAAEDDHFVARFYNAVAELEDTGVDIGDELRALLVEFESAADGAGNTDDGLDSATSRSAKVGEEEKS